MEFLQWEYFGNTVQKWLTALAATLVVFVGLLIIKVVLVRKLGAFAARTTTHLDDFVVGLFARTKLIFLLAVAVWGGSTMLVLSSEIKLALSRIAVLSLLVQGAIWANGLITLSIEHYRKVRAETDPSAATTVGALGFFGRLALWTVSLLLVLDNLGVNITTLVAGLGVGGIAVALAVQNILGDLFASLTIVLDKPFMVGDLIVVGDMTGTVEYIGLKTTRLRSLSGEQLVCSNADLLQSRIRNHKRMFERRVVFGIGVVYQTSHETLARIPEMLKEIVQSQQAARFDRAHFKEFSDSALQFEVVYYMKTPDFIAYMDAQQAINLAIYKKFAAERIAFAYPTRTVYLTGPWTSKPAEAR